MIDAVHQFVASYVPRDAIGTHVREARRVLLELGLRSEIYAAGFRDVPRGEARDFREHARRAGPPARSVLLYQLSTGSAVADYLLARPEPKAVDYHNVTPASFFAPWEPHVAVELEAGRRQLAALAPASRLGLADSAYNEAELREVGYRDTVVAPVLVDLPAMERTVDRNALGELEAEKRRGGADLLFVGRVSPNKCQHDIVKAFAVYRRLYDPRARLHLLGGPSSHAYWTALRRYVDALGLAGAVHLPGSVPDGVLAAHYRVADVLVCLSEHEGFCVPLLEAMWNRIPIVAFAASAVPETVGGAGLLLARKNPATVAAAVHRVLSDDALRARLVAAGEARLAEFSLERSRAAFRAAIEKLLADLA